MSGIPITGPQNTYQNDYQGYYSLAWTRGAHNLKFGAELDRQQINVLLGIATNGFFVFAPFPASDSFASFLLGQPVQFFQGGGDFNRGLRKWIAAGYAQDEWRVTSAIDAQLWVALRGQYSLHGRPESAERMGSGQAVRGERQRARRTSLPGRSGSSGRNRERRSQRAYAARWFCVGPMGRCENDRSCRLRHFLRRLHERHWRPSTGGSERAYRGRRLTSYRARA